MRKVFVVLAVAAAVLTMAFAPVRGSMNFREIVWQNLEDVEIQATLTAFGFYEGRFYLKLEGDEEYYVLFPLAIMRFENFEARLGDTLKVEGKKLLYNGKVLVIPETIEYNGKKYDLLQTMIGIRRGFDSVRPAPFGKPMMRRKPPMMPRTMPYARPGF